MLGVAHPTGYPTFLLLARAFQLLPVGDLAFRVNLLALTAALLAAAVAARAITTLCGDSPRARWAGAIAALALGLSPLLWSQAVIAEVYSLNALFAASLALFAVRDAAPGASQGWAARGRGLIAGLALGNHVTIGLMVLGWLAAVAAGAPRGARLGRVAARLLWVGLGLLVYLYLPLRAAAGPPINWGNPSSLAGLWWTISGAPYRDLAFGLAEGEAGGRAAAWASLLLEQFGLAGVALGFGGLLYSGSAGREGEDDEAPPRRRLLLGSAVIAAGYSAFAIGYASADSHAYMLPAYVLFAIWIGCGYHALLGALAPEQASPWAYRGSQVASRGAGRRSTFYVLRSTFALPEAGRRSTFYVLRSTFALGCAALIIAPAPARAARVDARHDGRAAAFAREALGAAPAGAVVVTEGDRDTFALWYAHYALGQRPDIAVAVGPLLDFAWYRETLRATYPWLVLPDTPPEDWAVALAAANPARPVCVTRLDAAEALVCGRKHRELRSQN